MATLKTRLLQLGSTIGLVLSMCLPVYAALQLHLPLDGNLNDISGNGRNGNYPGGNRNPGFTSAIYNQGLDFDGNNDYITVPSFSPGSTFSTSLWVKHDNIGVLNTFIEHAQNGNSRNDFYIGYDNSNNQLTVELEDTNTTEGGACGDPKFCTGIALSANRWYHVVVTVTPTTLDVYIDANLAYSTTHGTSVNFGNGTWLIGGDTDSTPVTTANSDYLDGQIDDLRIYDHQLSQQEISQLYGLVGNWTFDDCTITDTASIIDASGNGFNATAHGTISSTPGKICTAGQFDGTDAYVEIPHDNLLNGTTGLTYSAWIKPDDWTGSVRQVMAKSVHGGGSGRAQMGIFSESNLLKGRAETAAGRYEVNAPLPATGSWHHVALVFAGNRLSLYVDGVLQAGSSSMLFANTSLVTTTDPLNISKRVGTGQYYFAGAIDEVRVFNRALLAAEISAYFVNPDPANRTCPTCGGGPAPAGCASDYAVYTQGNLDLSGTITVNGNPVPNYDATANDGIDPATGNLVDVDPPFILPDINPASFVATTSNQDLFNPATVAAGDYDDITVTSTTTFSGGTYHMDRLQVGNGDTIILAPGDYFINRLNMGTNSNLVISPAGQVKLYINTQVTTGNGVNLNAGGSAANLTINLYSGADFELDNNGTMAGFVYSPFSNNLVDFDAGVTLTGGAITNGNLDMDNNTTIIYGSSEQAAAAAIVQCTAGPHHIQIEHDGIGLNCQAESITIKACGDAACAPGTLYTGDVVVDLFSSAPGSWSSGNQVTITNGSINVDLRALTPSIVTLSASNPSPATSETFSCVNSGPGNSCDIEFFPSGLVFDIPEQTSCTTSASVTVQALGTDPANPAQCVPLFSGSRTLKAWTTHLSPLYTDLVGTPALDFINNQVSPVTTTLPVSVPGSDNISLVFDANALASFQLDYADAGQLQLNLRFDGTGSETGLQLNGNNRFVVMPAQLNVYSSDTNADCVSGDASCSPFTAAGQAFNLNVSASCSTAEGGAVTPNFRINGITLSPSLVAPSGGNNAAPGVNSIDLIKTDSGNHLVNNQTVSEVGVFTFTATPPATYLGVPLTTPPATSVNIGRFYPHHFDTVVTQACTLGANPYTYAGQPFSVTLTALNGLSPATVTTNYFGDFVKNPYLTDRDAIYTLNNNTYDGTNFTAAAAGSATLSTVNFNFTNKHTTPQTVFIRGNELNDTPADSSDDISSAPGSEGSVLARSGRAVLDNAYGPEQLPLTLPLRFEYFSDAGTPADNSDDGFVINSDDSCSAYDTAAVGNSFANFTQNLSAGDTTASGAGMAITGNFDPANPLTLSAPGAGNHGSVNYVFNGVADWLKYNWNYDCDNADGDANISTGVDTGLCGPYGNASFGLYRGDDRIIFQREVLP